MRYLALACDYDGTLASDGRAAAETLEALRRLAASGRKLILVSGRQLDDLLRVFPEAVRFARVVAENGAVLYRPAGKGIRLLAQPPPQRFLQELQRRGVAPLFVGQVVVATEQPNESAVFDVIRELGLELHVIFNKGSIMVLPSDVDKATGLAAALQELSLSPGNVVGIGDAENDLAFLAMCGYAVAVANALDTVKEQSDYVTKAAAGAGVVELIDLVMLDDLPSIPS